MIDYDEEDEVCRMLGSLNLKGWSEPLAPLAVEPPVSRSDTPGSPPSPVVQITDGTGNVQFISAPACAPQHGCALLQSLHAHLPLTPAKSSSLFLESIFTHRESFVAFPAGHRGCAAAFTELAFILERRAQETGSDGDLDTAIALHGEAWLVSGWS
ncbi:hypothetical protein BD410DRAFT_843510 [Rickenella mellea]|uniref:Uncharacterized protein n=1 Tax=Rickenella mellea TaxID=50990 RepID=A0A4Y7PQZ8_9AGAM|nr:hypothetical protein BD410DRAFT_843510 [Rickenella mellea]